MLHQNKEADQERGRHEASREEGPTEERGNGVSQNDDEQALQDGSSAQASR